MNATVTWQGVDQMLAALRATPDKALRAAGASLYRIGSEIMADSQEHYVPVDLGILRDSGYVGLPRVSGSTVEVELGYGGAAQDYAAIQHEDLSLQHPNGGGPKYLERPLLERAKSLTQDVADDVRRDLGVGS